MLNFQRPSKAVPRLAGFPLPSTYSTWLPPTVPCSSVSFSKAASASELLSRPLATWIGKLNCTDLHVPSDAALLASAAAVAAAESGAVSVGALLVEADQPAVAAAAAAA